jgi:type IV pilus assembly protein PilQ
MVRYILALILLLGMMVVAPVYAQDQPVASPTPAPKTDDATPPEHVTEVPVDQTPASDQSFDELLNNKNSGPRNPFEPGEVDDEFDLSSLVVQGIVIGPNASMALIANHVVTKGGRIGNYNVKDIKPGQVVLSQLDDLFPIRLENYSPPLFAREQSKYYVEFYNADIKQALNLLAKAGGINIVVPEAVAGKVSVSFNNADIQDAFTGILHVNDLEFAVENGIMRVGKIEQFKDGADLKTISVPLRYAVAKDVQSKIAAILSERGKSTFDERTNVIIVKDKPGAIANVEGFIASVDRKDPQVSIEAKIIDATHNFARALGIQWGFTSGANNIVARGNQDTGSITNGNNTGSVVNLPASNPTSGFNILVGRLPGNSTLNAQLSAAESSGTIHIISKPTVTTINNKPANIRSGLKLYVKVDSGGANEGPKLQEIDTGVELSVTPQITINRLIKMTIQATESEADFSRTVDGIPSVLDNTASTTVLVPDGETAVIGGLLKSNISKNKQQAPGIGNVPVLGWLFKNTTKTKQSNELMIFITPHIMDTDAELSISRTDSSILQPAGMISGSSLQGN